MRSQRSIQNLRGCSPKNWGEINVISVHIKITQSVKTNFSRLFFWDFRNYLTYS